MSSIFEKLAERQMLKTKAQGGLSGLSGEGEPLPERPAETARDAAVNAGFRIMSQAGVRPAEFDLKDELAQARAEYQNLRDPDAKKQAMAKIADLDLRLSLACEARRAFFR